MNFAKYRVQLNIEKSTRVSKSTGTSISTLSLPSYNIFRTILRKTIEGYFDSAPSLTFNAIKTKLIMHAFHSSRYLQSK